MSKRLILAGIVSLLILIPVYGLATEMFPSEYIEQEEICMFRATTNKTVTIYYFDDNATAHELLTFNTELNVSPWLDVENCYNQIEGVRGPTFDFIPGTNGWGIIGDTTIFRNNSIVELTVYESSTSLPVLISVLAYPIITGVLYSTIRDNEKGKETKKKQKKKKKE